MINTAISIPGSRLFVFPVHTIKHDQGYAYTLKLPDEFAPGDSDEQPYASKIILFENGVAMWPAHALHEQIRLTGKGLHSHYGCFIWFSASDNSSPITNGYRYEIFIPGGLQNDKQPASGYTSPQESNVLNLSPFYRFCLARDAYRQIWPETRLPDIGRRIDSDTAFSADFSLVCPEADYTYERKFNLDQLFKLVIGIEGDVAECGTFKGGSAFFLARHIANRKLAKRLCLFDSFQGLSTPADIDGNWWTAGDLCSSMQELRRNLEPLGKLDFVELYQGWIPQRFSEVSGRRFCFVHIDVDLARPTKDSLEFFYPRLNKGAVLLFDDYGFDSCPGVTQVVDEFMCDKPELLVNLSAGGAFFIKT